MSDLVKFTPLDEKILELYTQGMDKDTIAIELEIPITEVKKVFRKPGIKNKLSEIIETKEVVLKEKILNILDKITEDMIQKAIENGDISKLLNKNRDILDVATVINNLTKEVEKKRLGTNENNIFINILNQLSED